MARVAYIRVSSTGQSLEIQKNKMLAQGVQADHIFAEKRSGIDSSRPALQESLRFVRRGDTFMITKIDRLARSATDLLNIVKQLEDKAVHLNIIDQNIDTSTPAGRAMLQMLAVFAEFETAIRSEHQIDGIAKAKLDGVSFGRKPQLTAAVIDEIKEMRNDGLLIKDIVSKVGLSKASVYRALAMT